MGIDRSHLVHVTFCHTLEHVLNVRADGSHRGKFLFCSKPFFDLELSLVNHLWSKLRENGGAWSRFYEFGFFFVKTSKSEQDLSFIQSSNEGESVKSSFCNIIIVKTQRILEEFLWRRDFVRVVKIVRTYANVKGEMLEGSFQDSSGSLDRDCSGLDRYGKSLRDFDRLVRNDLLHPAAGTTNFSVTITLGAKLHLSGSSESTPLLFIYLFCFGKLVWHLFRTLYNVGCCE